MESEWEPVLLEITPYKDTGTFIMKSAEETVQMLDDHIVMTQAMSFSPYKKPFEGRIMTLENKLRTTQVCRPVNIIGSGGTEEGGVVGEGGGKGMRTGGGRAEGRGKEERGEGEGGKEGRRKYGGKREDE